MRRILQSSIAIVGLAASVGASAQHSIDRLLFVNRSTGATEFGYLNEQNGGYVKTYGIPNQSELVGVTQVVNTPNGILFYNGTNGKAVIESTPANGFPSLGGFYQFGVGWDKIISVNNQLFFYATNGVAAVGHITPDLKFVQTQSFAAGSFGYWTHIVPTDEHIFFYNANNGAGAVGFLGPGGWQQTDTIPAGSFALNWSYIETTGKHILFYNQQSGLSASSYIDGKGKYSYVGSLNLRPGAQKLWRHGEYILVHNVDNGDTTVGYFNRDQGSPYTVTDTITLQSGYASTGYYRFASSDQDLLLYNGYSGGRAIVGHLTREGLFVTTQKLTGLPTWSYLVSSNE